MTVLQIIWFLDATYIIGGYIEDGTSVSDVIKFDHRKEKWTTVRPMYQPRDGISAVFHKNSIYVFGGSDSASKSILSSCEYYNIQTNT